MSCSKTRLIYLEAGNEVWACSCGDYVIISRASNLCYKEAYRVTGNSLLGVIEVNDVQLDQKGWTGHVHSKIDLSTKRFSVITPVRSNSPFISKLAQFLSWQSLKDFEWIVVEDGKESECVAEALANSGVSYIHLKTDHTGGWGNLQRNVGIQKAAGQYIAFIDDDDLPMSTWLERAYLCDSKVLVSGIEWPASPYQMSILPFDGKLAVGMISTQNIIVKSELAKKIGWPLSKEREADFEFIRRCMAVSAPFVKSDPRVGVILNGLKCL